MGKILMHNKKSNFLSLKLILNFIFFTSNQIKKKKGTNKFKRIIGTCEGKEINKIYINKIKQWVEKRDTLRNTTYIIDSPKKNFVTKITPKPSDTLTLPYKPEEASMKKTKKVGRPGNDNKVTLLD